MAQQCREIEARGGQGVASEDWVVDSNEFKVASDNEGVDKLMWYNNMTVLQTSGTCITNKSDRVEQDGTCVNSHPIWYIPAAQGKFNPNSVLSITISCQCSVIRPLRTFPGECYRPVPTRE